MKCDITDCGGTAVVTPEIQLNERLVHMVNVDLKDTRFQVRQHIDAALIEEYRAIVTQGDGVIRLRGFTGKPILWRRPEDNKFVICDGFHRIHAGEGQITAFEADIVVGSEQDAMLAAMKANLTHGKQLTRSERIEAVLRTVQALTASDGVQPSDAEVSRRLGIAKSTIRDHRNALQAEHRLQPPERIRGKDGKVQPVCSKRTARAEKRDQTGKATATPASPPVEHGAVVTPVAARSSKPAPKPIAKVDAMAADEQDKNCRLASIAMSESADDVPSLEHRNDIDADSSWAADCIRKLEDAVSLIEDLQRMDFEDISDRDPHDELIGAVRSLCERGRLFLEGIGDDVE